MLNGLLVDGGGWKLGRKRTCVCGGSESVIAEGQEP
jgi:hypothetical protein